MAAKHRLTVASMWSFEDVAVKLLQYLTVDHLN